MQAETSQVEPVPTSAPGATRLRLWPGIALAALLVAARIFATSGEFSPLKFFLGLLIVPFVVIAGLIIWWLFASRARRADRLLIVGAFIAVTAATVFIAFKTFPPMTLILYALPFVAVLWPLWLVATPMLRWPVRRAGLLAIFLAIGTVACLLRFDGADGEFNPEFSWRWSRTPEQQLMAELAAGSQSGKGAAGDLDVELKEQPGDWPEFRGPKRDGRVVGLKIRTDWDKSAPKELWKHRIGPGWSSFAVVNNRVFTQEQRGGEELVVCYDANSGAEVWSHGDSTRFNEFIAGPGPRSTPTFQVGKIYALGANGHLNCLRASDGKPIWSRDIAAEAGAPVPQWGFSSSPLVAQGIVSVFVGAPDNKSVIAFKADTGELAWTGGKGALSYCSTQLVNIDGVAQLLISTDSGVAAFEPVTGKPLWLHDWPSNNVARIVQPAVVGAHDLLIGTGMGVGTRRISVSSSGGEWTTKELWTSKAIKPYYNDLVIFDDHIYGFDGSFLVCVSLKDGSSKWKERGYGNGQLLLLADQGLLLILSEQGEVAIVRAQPEQLEELGRFKAIEGKTWNHPAVANGKLFVRNGERIACYQLPVAE